MRTVRSAVAVLGAVAILLTIQVVTAHSQAESARAVATALRTYQRAARAGTPAEREAALDALMSVLQREEGR